MPIGILFSGQGSQEVGMGLSLYEHSPLAKDIYDEADEILGWSLKKISFYGPEENLTETHICQPALYTIGYIVHALLSESGKLASARTALGLSLGELTALAATGALDFGTGLRVVAERGRLMQLACEKTTGTMACIIDGDQNKVTKLCSDFDIDIANRNCPGQVVISGDKSKVESAISEAKKNGDFRMVVPLNVAGAYHSRLMEPARRDFEKFLAEVEVKKPNLTVFSNVSGQSVSEPNEIKKLLVEQIVSMVRWEDCMRNASALGISDFYECGPGGILAGLAKRTDRSWKVTRICEYNDLSK